MLHKIGMTLEMIKWDILSLRYPSLLPLLSTFKGAGEGAEVCPWVL
jgi:hypothetical protein